MLADTVKYVIMSQHTELLGVMTACPLAVQAHKPKPTGRIGRVSIEHFWSICEYPCDIICCHTRWFPEAPGTVSAKSLLQNPQDVPLKDALTMASPLSPPHNSGKTSEAWEKNRDRMQTFKNNSIFRAPKVIKRLQDAVRQNVYRF